MTVQPQSDHKQQMNWPYFILIGWWFGIVWFVIALLMCWNPIGWVMVHKTPKIMFGE